MKSIEENILISIIVPAYNVAQFLPKCIESLINQTFKNFELILVNDGSTDNSGLICDDFAKNDNRIIVIHQKNNGLVSARKSGLAISKGKYVMYVDGDDYVENNYCELFVNQIINYDPDIVIGGYIRNYRGRTKTVTNLISAGVYEDQKLNTIWEKMIFSGEFFSHGISTYSWGKLFKRELLIPIQMSIPIDIAIGEDAACVYPFLSVSKKIVIIDDANYHYVQHQSSMLKNNSSFNSEVEKLSSLFAFMLNFFKNHIYYDSFYNQLKPYLLTQLIIRTGGLLINHRNELCLIGHPIGYNEKIAIYNSGTFGQQIFKKLINEKFNNIIWIDEDADLCNHDNLPVHDPKILKNIKVDKVFIASFNPIYIQKTSMELKELGINNIYYFNNMNNIESMILRYGINLQNFELQFTN